MPGVVQAPQYKRRREIWRSILHDVKDGTSEQIAQRRLQLLETWRPQPGEPLSEPCWRFLTARDLDGTPIIWTVDERDESAPVKSFPRHKDYLREILQELWLYRVTFIDKIRQKYISTLCMLAAWWFCAFFEEREVFVSRVHEESAVKLINDKIRVTHTKLPGWVQAALPITAEPKAVITWKETGSTITGVAQNFAVTDSRGPTASLVIVDEAAFQTFFPEIYRAVMPMAARLWAVTTANIGNPGAAKFKELAFEGRPNL